MAWCSAFATLAASFLAGAFFGVVWRTGAGVACGVIPERSFWRSSLSRSADDVSVVATWRTGARGVTSGMVVVLGGLYSNGFTPGGTGMCFPCVVYVHPGAAGPVLVVLGVAGVVPPVDGGAGVVPIDPPPDVLTAVVSPPPPLPVDVAPVVPDVVEVDAGVVVVAAVVVVVDVEDLWRTWVHRYQPATPPPTAHTQMGMPCHFFVSPDPVACELVVAWRGALLAGAGAGVSVSGRVLMRTVPAYRGQAT